MSQKLSSVKGMNDLLPPQIELWHHVERAAHETFRRFGYREVRTPILEDTSLFVRAVGEATDIVGKEMYTFQDKAGRSLSMRPEGTAPAVRAYLEHNVSNQEPTTRWYYLGPMFRYERMKTGRYRQFWQVGLEAYGAKEPAQDVEVMDLVRQFLEALPLSGVRLKVNSLGDAQCRPAYLRQLVAHFEGHKESLCGDCGQRLEKNPLRILDCKVEGCRQIAKAAPSMIEFLCEGCRTHFDEVQRQLGLLDIRFEVDPQIVRGLDYYTRTAFEFVADHPVLGTASTVGGGGRYDGLVKELGGPVVAAVGVALGLDRLVLLLGEAKLEISERPVLFVTVADDGAKDEAQKLVSRLRRGGHAVDMDVRAGSLKSQMKRADKSGAVYSMVLGGNELSSGQVELKHMAGGDSFRTTLAELGEVLANARVSVR